MDETNLLLLKKKLKAIKKFRGTGTQLISVYLPPDADRSSVTKQLTDEQSQSSNIKSSQTRKNVQAALKRIINYLRQIDFRLPENGLVLFSGDVSTNPSKSDVTLLEVIPPKRLTTKLYWCDSAFHTAPLEEMAETDEVYGFIAVDKREATLALLRGKAIQILSNETSAVPGKSRAGGQCLKDAFIQLADGNIVDIEELSKKQEVKSINFNNYTLLNSVVSNKWNTKKNEIYTIITKEPRLEIQSSKDHLFFVHTGTKVIEKAAEDLKEGDTLLMPEKIDIKGTIQAIDSKKYYNSFTITEEGRNLLKKEREKRKLFQKEFAKSLGVTQTAISGVEIGKVNVSRLLLKEICNKLKINYSNFLKKYTINTIYTNIKLPTTVDKEFAQFIGYFAGDGSLEEDRITFFEQSKEVALYYKQKFDSYFSIDASYKFREAKNYHQLRFTSRPLVRLIKEEFPELKKARDTLIPKKILCSSNNVLASFLKGLFDAEGYVNLDRGIGFGINNKKLATQVQLVLLRFSIISSLVEYDNYMNPYTDNHRFTISITEKESLQLFKKEIGFTSSKKLLVLTKVIDKKSNMERSRQIILSGSVIRQIIESRGFNLELFPKVSNFFNNKRMMGKVTFENSILKRIKDKKLYSDLKKIMDYPVIPVKINKINIQKSKGTSMVDITVKNQNFIANGLVVHNSSHRFERLREKAEEDFYKRVGEKVNAAFVGIEKLKGIVVGGPGHSKNWFLEAGDLDHRIKNKVLGTIDTSYTDESGIKEILDKSGDILKEVGVMKERTIVNKFVEKVAKNELATYGYREVMTALDLGQVDTILLSEGITWMANKYKCNSCNNIDYKIVRDPEKEEKKETIACSSCSQDSELIEELDIFDYFVEIAENTSTKVELISVDSPEGKLFFETFGGLGAFLRYKI